MAEVLAKQPRPRGPRLTIVTNAGGPGVLATDALIAGGGRAGAAVGRDDRRRSNALLPAALEPRQPDRRPGRRRPRALRQGARDRRRATRTATACWSILTPQAMTDPTQTAERLKALRPDRGQAGPGQLDGRGRRRRRRGDPQPGRHPDLRLPRHRRPRLQRTCGATATTSAASTRPRRWPAEPDEDEPDRDRGRGADRGASAPSGRTLLTESSRSSCSPPTASRPSPTRVARDEDAGRRGRRRDRLPGRPQAPLRDDHAQDRRRRRAAEPGRRRRRCARPIARSRRRSRERAGAEHFLGVTVQPMVELRRLRADRRQQPRPAVRPGAAVRHRRAAGRGLQGPRAGPAAAEHDAGPADDGADAIFTALQGRPRPRAGRPGGAGAAAGPLQPARRRAALDQGDRHQPAARLAARARRARRPRGRARCGRRRGPAPRGSRG